MTIATVSDIDIWRAANLLIQQHGEKAWDEAVGRYFDMRDAGDAEGMRTWRRIANAIASFTDPRPTSRPLLNPSDVEYTHPTESEHFLN